jgi:hypothetical protein
MPSATALDFPFCAGQGSRPRSAADGVVLRVLGNDDTAEAIKKVRGVFYLLACLASSVWCGCGVHARVFGHLMLVRP